MNESEATLFFVLFSQAIPEIFPLTACTYSILMFGHDQLEQEAQNCNLLWLTHVLQAGINQSEVEDSFQLASDCIKSVGKNVNKSKAVTLLGSLL